MARIPSPLISLFILLQAQTPSAAADIIFKLRNFAEQPVPGRVEMQVPKDGKEIGASWITVATTSDGRLSNAKCAPPGIVFRASSYDQTYFLETAEMMKSCIIGEIIFHFRRKDYADLLEKALSDKSEALTSASTDAKSLHVSLLTAIAKFDYAAAATNSMLLYDTMHKELGPDAAEPFRVLATDVGASPLTQSQPLIFDPKQKKYVLSPDSVKAVAHFQKMKGLSATGNLDWSTAEKLPNTEGLYVGMR